MGAVEPHPRQSHHLSSCSDFQAVDDTVTVHRRLPESPLPVMLPTHSPSCACRWSGGLQEQAHPCYMLWPIWLHMHATGAQADSRCPFLILIKTQSRAACLTRQLTRSPLTPRRGWSHVDLLTLTVVNLTNTTRTLEAILDHAWLCLTVVEARLFEPAERFRLSSAITPASTE